VVHAHVGAVFIQITKNIFTNHGGIQQGGNGAVTTVTEHQFRPLTAHGNALTNHGTAALMNSNRLPFFIRNRRIIRPDWGPKMTYRVSLFFLVWWTLWSAIGNPHEAFSKSCSDVSNEWWMTITNLLPLLYVITLLTVCVICGARLSRFDQGTLS
jgi:hypothetical protein